MINKINALKQRFNKSKDSKTLASNFGYLMLLQVAGYIFPVLTLPYLARVIGVEGFGKIAFAVAVVVWFQTVTDWGFRYTATRDVAQNRDNPEKISEIFSNVLWAKILLAFISFAMLLIAIETIPYFKENQAVLLVTFLLVPGNIFFPDWFFQAMEKMKFITVFNLISKALFTVLVFIFINEKSDYILQPLFISMGYLVSGICAMYIILVKWDVRLSAPKWNKVYLTIKNSTDIFINNIMPNFYNSFSTVLLGFFGGSIATGLLSAGTQFVNISQQFILIISRVFFPFLSRNLTKHNIYVKINLSISILFTFILILAAPYIIKLFFTQDFYKAISVLQIMSLSIVFVALIDIYGTNYMIIKGYGRELRNITFIASLIGFSLSFPLIYFYGFIGAAITVTATRGIHGLSVMYRAISIERTNRTI